MAGDRLMTAFRATVSVPKPCLPEARLLFSCYSWQGLEWQAINGSHLLLPAHNHDKNSTVVCVFLKVNAGSSLSAMLSLWLSLNLRCSFQRIAAGRSGHQCPGQWWLDTTACCCSLGSGGLVPDPCRPLMWHGLEKQCSTFLSLWRLECVGSLPEGRKCMLGLCASGCACNRSLGSWKLKQIRGLIFLLTASAGLILGIRHVTVWKFTPKCFMHQAAIPR